MIGSPSSPSWQSSSTHLQPARRAFLYASHDESPTYQGSQKRIISLTVNSGRLVKQDKGSFIFFFDFFRIVRPPRLNSSSSQESIAKTRFQTLNWISLNFDFGPYVWGINGGKDVRWLCPMRNTGEMTVGKTDPPWVSRGRKTKSAWKRAWKI